MKASQYLRKHFEISSLAHSKGHGFIQSNYLFHINHAINSNIHAIAVCVNKKKETIRKRL